MSNFYRSLRATISSGDWLTIVGDPPASRCPGEPATLAATGKSNATATPLIDPAPSAYKPTTNAQSIETCGKEGLGNPPKRQPKR